jgi:hypothetical protein
MRNIIITIIISSLTVTLAGCGLTHVMTDAGLLRRRARRLRTDANKDFA